MATYATILAARQAHEGFVLALEGIDAYFVSEPTIGDVWTDRTSIISTMRVAGELTSKTSPVSTDPVKQDTLSFEIDDAAGAASAIFNATPNLSVYAAGAVEANAATIACDTHYTLASWPAAGTFWIGAERITYAARTAAEFQGCSRGTLPPLGTAAEWAQRHWIDEKYPTDFQPLITDYPAEHYGRRLVVWHTFIDPDTGTWLAKADSEVIFVGRIKSLSYDGAGRWKVEAGHLGLDLTQKLHDPPFEGQTSNRILLPDGDYRFTLAATYSIAGVVYAVGPFDVVITAASLRDEEDGVAWLRRELAAEIQTTIGALAGVASSATDWLAADQFYGWAVAVSWGADSAERTRISYRIPSAVGTATGSVNVVLTPEAESTGYEDARKVARILGLPEHAFDISHYEGDYTYDYHPSGSVLRSYWESGTMPVDTARGVWRPQAMPSVYSTYEGWLLVEGDDYKSIHLALQSGGTTDHPEFTLGGVMPGMESLAASFTATRSYSVKQVFVPEWMFTPACNTVLSLLLSSGAATNVEAGADNWDRYTYPFGVGIPASLVDLESIEAALVGHQRLWLFDEAISPADLIKNECALAGVHPVWYGQRLEFRPLNLRVSGRPDMTLSNANKADDKRPTAKRDTSTIVNSWRAKLGWNYQADQWRYDATIGNPASQRAYKVKKEGQSFECKGYVAGFTAPGRESAEIEGYLHDLVLANNLLSQPHWVVSTTGNRTTMGLVAGDLVTLTESWVPGPAGGVGTEFSLPALVLSTSYDLGERRNAITLMVIGDAYEMAPSWLLTSYAAGPPSVVTIDPGEYGPLVDDDGTAYLADTYEVRIVEHDAADPTAPQSWNRTVSNVDNATDTFEVDSALAGYDPTKRYIVTFRGYGSVVAAQQSVCYLAADATHIVTGDVVFRYV